jgi:hypothetical protein
MKMTFFAAWPVVKESHIRLVRPDPGYPAAVMDASEPAIIPYSQKPAEPSRSKCRLFTVLGLTVGP